MFKMSIEELMDSITGLEIRAYPNVLKIVSVSKQSDHEYTITAENLETGREFTYSFPEDYGLFNLSDVSYDVAAKLIKKELGPIIKEEKKKAKSQNRPAVIKNARPVVKEIVFEPDTTINSAQRANSEYSFIPVIDTGFTSSANDKKPKKLIAEIGDIVLLLDKDANGLLRIKLDEPGNQLIWDGASFKQTFKQRIDDNLNNTKPAPTNSPLGKLVYNRTEGDKFTRADNGDFVHYEILKIEKCTMRDKTKEELKKGIEQRKISELVHFTHIDNIPSILDWGALLPRDKHAECGITAHYSDVNRLDGYLDKTSLSVSFPNAGMFYFKRQRGVFAVITFRPEFLYSDDCVGCKFYYDNAASSRSHGGYTYSDFENMFRGQRFNELEDKYTSTYQAEILIDGDIPVKYIQSIEVETKEAKKEILKAIDECESICKLNAEHFKRLIVVNPRFFSDDAINMWGSRR